MASYSLEQAKFRWFSLKYDPNFFTEISGWKKNDYRTVEIKIYNKGKCKEIISFLLF